MRTVEPKDVVVLHPDALKRVQVKSELDQRLVEALEWGYAFHPELRTNVGTIGTIDETLEIEWPNDDDIAEDVLEAVNIFTVPVDLPIAGLAEHLIGFRRLLKSQYLDVKNGDSWRMGANAYLKRVVA